jgi:hypothetical protein
VHAEVHGVARNHLQVTVHLSTLELQPSRGGEHQPFRSAARRHASVDWGQDRGDQAVLRTRTVGDLHLDASGFAGDPPDEYVGSLGPQPVVAVVRADEQGVGDRRYSRDRLEPCLEDQRSIHIAAHDAEWN